MEQYNDFRQHEPFATGWAEAVSPPPCGDVMPHGAQKHLMAEGTRTRVRSTRF